MSLDTVEKYREPVGHRLPSRWRNRAGSRAHRRLSAIVVAIIALSAGPLCHAQPEIVDISDSVARIEEWFEAWELVSVDVYATDLLRPVDFIFFDSRRVYSTMEIPGGGLDFDGPRLMNHRFDWRHGEHDGSLQLPDGSVIPIGLMSFAAPMDDSQSRAFFVMPLPAFWEEAGIDSAELGRNNLLTGVFLHEFAHSQQMHSFGRQLSEFERAFELQDELTDDVVQERFEHDRDYQSVYREEVERLYAAAHSDRGEERLALTRSALNLYRLRQQQFFVGDLAMFQKLDDFFLTMEGFGQYTMYAWLVHPRGGALDARLAEAGVRRGGRWWSQDEGLALFLLLQQLSDPKLWADKMLGVDYRLAIDLISAGVTGE